MNLYLDVSQSRYLEYGYIYTYDQDYLHTRYQQLAIVLDRFKVETFSFNKANLHDSDTTTISVCLKPAVVWVDAYGLLLYVLSPSSSYNSRFGMLRITTNFKEKQYPMSLFQYHIYTIFTSTFRLNDILTLCSVIILCIV